MDQGSGKFNSVDELMKAVGPLLENNEYVVNIKQMPDKSFQANWFKHKTYIAQDGLSYPDEIWLTRDREAILIQDLSVEHCRNIVRKFIREEREAIAADQEVINEFTSAISQLSEEIVGVINGISVAAGGGLNQAALDKKIDDLFPPDIKTGHQGPDNGYATR